MLTTSDSKLIIKSHDKNTHHITKLASQCSMFKLNSSHFSLSLVTYSEMTWKYFKPYTTQPMSPCITTGCNYNTIYFTPRPQCYVIITCICTSTVLSLVNVFIVIRDMWRDVTLALCKHKRHRKTVAFYSLNCS